MAKNSLIQTHIWMFWLLHYTVLPYTRQLTLSVKKKVGIFASLTLYFACTADIFPKASQQRGHIILMARYDLGLKMFI